MLVLNGQQIGIEDVIRVALQGEKVALGKKAIMRIQKCRGVVEELVNKKEIVYGVTTGFGSLANTGIESKDIAQLQVNIVKSHSASVGKPFDKEIVRAATFLRISTLSRGYSGVRLETVQALVKLLNSEIHPIIPEKGSVGASGDLSPLAHMALVLIGRGKAEYKGKILNGKDALKKAGLKPLELKAKEGLALVNGTQIMSAIGCLAIVKSEALAKNADISASMSIEALKAKKSPFDKKTNKLKPYRGQMNCASNIRKLIAGSSLINMMNGQVQDAYSIRCTPHVHGAVRETIAFCRKTIETEINSITDNPLVCVEARKALSCGNFHGEALAFALDFLGIAMSEIASISERRINRLTDAKLSNLPPFLVKNAGLNSGFMIAQYTAAALVSENKVLSHPASVDSIPTSADQEDHVSMGSISANKVRTILFNVQNVLAIEFLCSSQALDLAGGRKGKGTKAAQIAVRKKVPFFEQDTEVSPEIAEIFGLIEDQKIVKAVENAVGKLE